MQMFVNYNTSSPGFINGKLDALRLKINQEYSTFKWQNSLILF